MCELKFLSTSLMAILFICLQGRIYIGFLKQCFSVIFSDYAVDENSPLQSHIRLSFLILIMLLLDLIL